MAEKPQAPVPFDMTAFASMMATAMVAAQQAQKPAAKPEAKAKKKKSKKVEGEAVVWATGRAKFRTHADDPDTEFEAPVRMLYGPVTYGNTLVSFQRADRLSEWQTFASFSLQKFRPVATLFALALKDGKVLPPDGTY
jgi:hypothetical protein